MLVKVFSGATCPYNKSHVVDSPPCRKCKCYFRFGTQAFIWCNRPESEEKPKRKPGRPAKRTPKKDLVKFKWQRKKK